MTTRTLAIVSAGVGQPSSSGLLADRLATAASRKLSGRDVEAELVPIELREYAHDLTDNLLTFFASDRLQAAKDAVAAADGLIAVTPIYTGSYNGLFKTFFDLLEVGALTGTPVLLGATAGSPRHSLALEHAIRPLFSQLRALTTPTAVFVATEDWGAEGTAEGSVSARIDRAGAEFAELVATRSTSRPAPVELPTTFGELLDAS